jgi:hypothetical protein
MAEIAIETGRSWAELVFHVLAHVRATAHLPASAYDETYVAFVAAHAGPAAERTLAEDAAVLGPALPTHELLARAQLVALLFGDAAEAGLHAAVDLHDLPRRELGAALAEVARAAEILRCAALLEEEVVAALPATPLDVAALRDAIALVLPAAPRLASYRLVAVRSLRLRGRLFGDEIWIGAPSAELALGAEHVAWQAAHEATVGEVALRMRGERAVEHAAVALLRERAAAAGVAEGHARWFAHLAPEPAPASTRAR